MKTKETFKKVYIKSEADLPKDKEEKYWVKYSNSNRMYLLRPSKTWIINEAEYYLRPVEAQFRVGKTKEQIIDVLKNHQRKLSCGNVSIYIIKYDEIDAIATELEAGEKDESRCSKCIYQNKEDGGCFDCFNGNHFHNKPSDENGVCEHIKIQPSDAKDETPFKDVYVEKNDPIRNKLNELDEQKAISDDTGKIIFDVLNHFVYNETNEAGSKLNIINSDDLPEIIPLIVDKLKAQPTVSLPDDSQIHGDFIKEFGSNPTTSLKYRWQGVIWLLEKLQRLNELNK